MFNRRRSAHRAENLSLFVYPALLLLASGSVLLTGFTPVRAWHVLVAWVVIIVVIGSYLAVARYRFVSGQFDTMTTDDAAESADSDPERREA
jgi:Ni,Fe-hydrogenase I cytochrome b subunit